MKQEKGFTLLELIATLAIASILLSVGVPSFRSVIMDSRMVRDTNQFVASINLARSSAVRFQRNATVCVSANFNAPLPSCSGSSDWSGGWIVWVDKDRDGAVDTDEILAVQEPIDNTTSFSATNAPLFSYDARGFLRSPADELMMCDNRAGETGRRIRVNAAGRTHVKQQGCS